MDEQAEKIFQENNNGKKSFDRFHRLKIPDYSPDQWHLLEREFAYQLFRLCNRPLIVQLEHLSRQTLVSEVLSL